MVQRLSKLFPAVSGTVETLDTSRWEREISVQPTAQRSSSGFGRNGSITEICSWKGASGINTLNTGSLIINPKFFDFSA